MIHIDLCIYIIPMFSTEQVVPNGLALLWDKPSMDNPTRASQLRCKAPRYLCAHAYSDAHRI